MATLKVSAHYSRRQLTQAGKERMKWKARHLRQSHLYDRRLRRRVYDLHGIGARAQEDDGWGGATRESGPHSVIGQPIFAPSLLC
jgi:hypothetical protein